MKLLVSPHNDDSVLFAAFTLQRERPLVLTVFDSFAQVAGGHEGCDAMTRRSEDMRAVHDVLGCDIQFGGVRDDEPANTIRAAVLNALTSWSQATEVWLPAIETNGHEQHNLVGEIGGFVFLNSKIHRYLTYTRTGGKSTRGIPVDCNGSMVLKKLQALVCYRTQIEIDALGCWPHFIRDQNEYLEENSLARS